MANYPILHAASKMAALPADLPDSAELSLEAKTALAALQEYRKQKLASGAAEADVVAVLIDQVLPPADVTASADAHVEPAREMLLAMLADNGIKHLAGTGLLYPRTAVVGGLAGAGRSTSLFGSPLEFSLALGSADVCSTVITELFRKLSDDELKTVVALDENDKAVHLAVLGHADLVRRTINEPRFSLDAPSRYTDMSHLKNPPMFVFKSTRVYPVRGYSEHLPADLISLPQLGVANGGLQPPSHRIALLGGVSDDGSFYAVAMDPTYAQFNAGGVLREGRKLSGQVPGYNASCGAPRAFRLTGPASDAEVLEHSLDPEKSGLSQMLLLWHHRQQQARMAGEASAINLDENSYGYVGDYEGVMSQKPVTTRSLVYELTGLSSESRNGTRGTIHAKVKGRSGEERISFKPFGKSSMLKIKPANLRRVKPSEIPASESANHFCQDWISNNVINWTLCPNRMMCVRVVDLLRRYSDVVTPRSASRAREPFVDLC